MFALWLGFGPGLVRADDASQRARIARERAEATAQFEQRRRDCEQRFAVTACVDQARAEHRQLLLRLRHQEGVLDEAQRKQRAAQRLAEIQDKLGAEDARDRTPRPARREPRARTSVPRQPVEAAREVVREAAAPASQASAPERSAREARSRARFEARQQQAQAQKEAAAKRQAERAGAGKTPATPLPAPR